MTSIPLISLNLFGPFICHDINGDVIKIRATKQQALLAILAVAAKGLHSRSWLQGHLWGRSGDIHGRASLRRALSDFRKLLGADFETLFDVSNAEIRLRQRLIKIVTEPQRGEFLEGIRITEPKFNIWLAQQRNQCRPHFATSSDERLDLAPRVAVLPIVSTLGRPDASHFGGLVAAEISRCLSRSQMVDVISHLSSRKLQQPMLEIDTVKKDLGATYVLTGHMSNGSLSGIASNETLSKQDVNTKADTVSVGAMRWDTHFAAHYSSAAPNGALEQAPHVMSIAETSRVLPNLRCKCALSNTAGFISGTSAAAAVVSRFIAGRLSALSIDDYTNFNPHSVIKQHGANAQRP